MWKESVIWCFGDILQHLQVGSHWTVLWVVNAVLRLVINKRLKVCYFHKIRLKTIELGTKYTFFTFTLSKDRLNKISFYIYIESSSLYLHPNTLSGLTSTFYTFFFSSCKIIEDRNTIQPKILIFLEMVELYPGK